MNLSKTFEFPKIAFYGKRKVNKPTVEMSLRVTDDGKCCLTICGDIWNATQTDVIMCGQCLDEMDNYKSLHDDNTFKTLYRLWKAYHLNDMHCGTKAQERALIDHFGKRPRYEIACEYLKNIGLYEDENENGYVYGSKYLYWEIPTDDIKLIKEMLED